MSVDTPTLYQAECHSPVHDDPKWDHGDDITECMVQHPIRMKLVPVEPDYRAAHQMAREVIGAVPMRFSRMIVDAALGLEADDGE